MEIRRNPREQDPEIVIQREKKKKKKNNGQ